MIIAIDGPAGSGKSTIAREVASRFGFSKLDTGAMYRSVALAALRRGIDLADVDAVAQLARDIHITFGGESHGNVSVFVDGEDVSEAIRTPEVDRNVSAAAANPGVRSAMLDPQRRFALDRDVVAEGRDIGTVVFPAAELKVFLTADPVSARVAVCCSVMRASTLTRPRSRRKSSRRSRTSNAATHSTPSAKPLLWSAPTMRYASIPPATPSSRSWTRSSSSLRNGDRRGRRG